MKTKLVSLISALIIGYAQPNFAQDQTTTQKVLEKAANFDLAALDSLAEFFAMKIEGYKFKVEDYDGIDISKKVQALKTPNKLDLLFYDPGTEATAVCYEFYSQETKNNEWLPCDLLPESSTGLYWVLSNDYKSFYIIYQGAYLEMQKYKLKASPTSKGDFIVQENGVDKYTMNALKGKKQDEFYPLELIR